MNNRIITQSIMNFVSKWFSSGCNPENKGQKEYKDNTRADIQ